VLGLQEIMSSVTGIREQFKVKTTKGFDKKYKTTLLNDKDFYVSED
jgi:hypothetical protein